ncbi:hypothetical protein AQI95_02765 [Streptomyces yokosukanensis]|uniref:Tyr recombinase domain-containing protein n=2 Tax=Streptomyces TaxID=1883 RepID=A0A101PE86_9ACTN|nr:MULTISPECIES: site-specific integrase [Streptomyces]KUN09903.1 hypothetical protein AQI95_02765 [Streptomyces yokosukanensis]MDF2270646.1 site-specific integrase [Streptomyces coacervatus]
MTTDLLFSSPVAAGPTSARPLRGRDAANVIRSFPPRPRITDWPATSASLREVMARIEHPPLNAARELTQYARRTGCQHMLDWLETFPGDTWQERWNASPATTYADWASAPQDWLNATGQVSAKKTSLGYLAAGVLTLTCADVIRPSPRWLAGNSSRYLPAEIIRTRDPEGFEELRASMPESEWTSNVGDRAVHTLARIIAAYGGRLKDITVGDLLSFYPVTGRSVHSGIRLAYVWLRDRGNFPAHAPGTFHHLGARTGQVSPEDLVDRYDLQCKPVRDLIVDYLKERQPSLDYNSLKNMSSALARLFWADLERHHPGIDSLRLAPEVAEGWKARIAVKTVHRRQIDGSLTKELAPRTSAASTKMLVRAFYLDIAAWALEEPERWGPWAAPNPISEADCTVKKVEREQKARTDQRTRERLPVLPALIRAANRRLKEARVRLEAVESAPLGSQVTVLGETFTLPKTTTRVDGKPGKVFNADGKVRSLRTEEKHAFFAWATIEILRHTGIRIEELLELGHHSIISYKLPTTGDVVPLLQIAPSKTDQERLLLINPELADVLSAVIQRVRGADGTVPSVGTYDSNERIWNPPMPVLYQWQVSGENRHISISSIRRALNDTLAASGLVDSSGRPLQFQPHDFRRIFITDAIMNGLPPHIAQVIAGHRNINTTMGYAAIYPAEAIEAHRAFIARRRTLRPSEEYRSVSPEEWEEFLGHFERRKLALGQCGRAYGTDCAHEHACVRCPVLIVGSEDRGRLEEIRQNLEDRITEAQTEGWLGEVEGLSVSLAAAEEKIALLDARLARQNSSVFLGIPTLSQLTVRTAEGT